MENSTLSLKQKTNGDLQKKTNHWKNLKFQYDGKM